MVTQRLLGPSFSAVKRTWLLSVRGELKDLTLRVSIEGMNCFQDMMSVLLLACQTLTCSRLQTEQLRGCITRLKSRCSVLNTKRQQQLTNAKSPRIDL